MDLFSVLDDEIVVDPNLKEKLDELCEFVSTMDGQKLRQLEDYLKHRDFEESNRAARAFQAFAYENKLRTAWWKTVDRVKAKRMEADWSAGWDEAFPCAVALLLKPWVGKRLSAKDYDLVTGPLASVGFKL